MTKIILPYMQMGGEHGIRILIVVVVFYSHVVSRLTCHAGSPIFTSNFEKSIYKWYSDTKRHATCSCGSTFITLATDQ